MTLSDRFSDALVYATRLHAGQTRKVSGVPYVSHLLRTAGIALAYGADEDEAIAALLHDAVEDQGGPDTREEIRRRFGDRVTEIVDGSSDTDQHPKPPWRGRKEAFLDAMRAASPSVRLVVAADKLDNVRSLAASYRTLGDAVWDRFAGGRDGTLWYFRALVESLQSHGPHDLVSELDLAVDELERAVRGGVTSDEPQRFSQQAHRFSQRAAGFIPAPTRRGDKPRGSLASKPAARPTGGWPKTLLESRRSPLLG